MDFFHNSINMLFLLKANKPDVFYLVLFLVGYFLIFSFFASCRKLFKKKQKDGQNQKKGLAQDRKHFVQKLEKDINPRKHKEKPFSFFEYVLGVKDAIVFIWIRRKISNDNKISIPLHQAIYLMRHYPEYFYYAGEKQKILFERINRKIFEPIQKKNFDIQNDKSIDEDIKKIELRNGSKVLLDHDGIIQDFISPEREDKEIAKKILNDFGDQSEIKNVENVSQNTKNSLDSKMKDFFENSSDAKGDKEPQEEKKDLEATGNRALTKKELKEKMKKEKEEKKDSLETREIDTEKIEDIVNSIMKDIEVKNTKEEQKKQIKNQADKTEMEIKENLVDEVENPKTDSDIKQDKPKEKIKIDEVKINEKKEEMIFDIETPNIVFLREKIKKKDFGESVFLLNDALVFNKDFFMNFLKSQNEDANEQEMLLKNLIRKFELSYDIEILANQVVSGTYKEQKIDGKFYVIKISEDERNSIEKNIF